MKNNDYVISMAVSIKQVLHSNNSENSVFRMNQFSL